MRLGLTLLYTNLFSFLMKIMDGATGGVKITFTV